MIFAGLDLAGYKKKEKTVLTFIEEKKIVSLKKLDDEEIVEKILLKKPCVFAIDSPLSFPKNGIFRYSDEKLRELLERKNLKYLKKFILPLSLKSMRILTKRAIKIKNSIKNIKIIETHPTICIFLILIENKIDVKKFLSYKRDKNTFVNLLKILEKILGYRFNFKFPDELDSFICAWISSCFYKGEKILFLSKTKTPFVIYKI